MTFSLPVSSREGRRCGLAVSFECGPPERQKGIGYEQESLPGSGLGVGPGLELWAPIAI
jgi:hypothetical protein